MGNKNVFSFELAWFERQGFLDIVARVFMLKLKELMNDIKNEKCFGQTIASKFT